MFTCKLPGGEWLNLAQIRSIQIEETPLLVMVVWVNGDRSFYRHNRAVALLEAWGEAKGVDKSHIQVMRSP